MRNMTALGLVLGPLILIIALGRKLGLLKPGPPWGHSASSPLFIGIGILAWSLRDLYEDQLPALAEDAALWLGVIFVLAGTWVENKARAKAKRDSI